MGLKRRKGTRRLDTARESGGKSPNKAAWLSWSVCVVSLALATVGLLLLVLSREARASMPVFEEWAEDAVIAVGFSTLGAIVAPRFPPRNPIGWLFCAIGLVGAVLLFSGEYAAYSLLARPGSPPAGPALRRLVSRTVGVHPLTIAFFGPLLT